MTFADGPVACEIGTGSIDFEPLTDGETITLTKGPQGGQVYHLWVAARVGNPSASAATVTITARIEQTGELIGRPVAARLPFDCGAATTDVAGLRYILSVDPSVVRGKRVVLDLATTFSDGWLMGRILAAT